MKIHGINVDAQAIANGLYKIICEQGQAAIVAHGMLPKDLMDSLETMVAEKVQAESLRARLCLSPEEQKRTVRAIVHEVGVGIYRAASDAGMMLV
jgi:hypothetical protein